MNLKIKASSQFKKDIKRLIRRKENMALLEEAINILQIEGKLPPRYQDHQLSGEWKIVENST